MKRGIVFILVLLLVATSAQALIYRSILTPDVTTPGTIDVAVRYLPEGQDTRVLVWIPDLDIISHRHAQADDVVKTTHVLVDIPYDTLPGDYLVRYVISTDRNQIVRYRWLTVV